MNILLLPASHQNIQRTVLEPVELDRVEKRLNGEPLEKLTKKLGGARSFRCWGTTVRQFYERMSSGDEVLFAVSGTGFFKWRGRIGFKLDCPQLGEELWGTSDKQTGLQRSMAGKPYNFIYEICDFREISIPKYPLINAFGYSELMRAQFAKGVEIKIKEHGSFESMLNSFKSR